MAQVQQPPYAVVFRILLHEIAFDFGGPADHPFGNLLGLRSAEVGDGFFIGLGIGQQEGLEHFRGAAQEFPAGQGPEKIRIDIHEFRLAEGAHHILVAVEVHAVLAADGGVDLRKQCRRHESEGKPAFIDGGHEAGDVGGDAAAHAQEHRVAAGLQGQQFRHDALHGRERLLRFGSVDPDDRAVPGLHNAAAAEPLVRDHDGSLPGEQVGYLAVGKIIFQCCRLRCWRCGRGACRCRPCRSGVRGGRGGRRPPCCRGR